jgi:hypothetical protein
MISQSARSAIGNRRVFVARVSARRATRVSRTIMRLLRADRRPSPRAIRVLAARAHVAEALNRLAAIATAARATSEGVMIILMERGVAPSVLLHRLACHYGAVPDSSVGHRRYQPPITVEELRSDGSPQARMALACFGLLDCWRTATQEQRAAYCLSRLIRERSP